MSKTTEKTGKQPTVIVRIVPGKAATEHHEKLWRAFWRQIAEKARAGAKSGNG